MKAYAVFASVIVPFAGTSAQTPRTLVVVGFVLVGSEELDAWEALDAVLGS